MKLNNKLKKGSLNSIKIPSINKNKNCKNQSITEKISKKDEEDYQNHNRKKPKKRRK